MASKRVKTELKTVDIESIGDTEFTTAAKKLKKETKEVNNVPPQDSHCYCNSVVMKRKVMKVSKNQNRNFITCAEKLYDPETATWLGGCTYFKWEDECLKICDTCQVFKATTKDGSRYFCANVNCDLKAIMRQKLAEKKAEKANAEKANAVDHNYQAGTQPLPEPTTPEGDEDGK
jgi:hypothetical protein